MRTGVEGKKTDRGSAMLEAAAVFLSFMTLLSLALPVVDYIQTTETLSRVIDKHLYDQVVKPFSLDRRGALQLEKTRLSSTLGGVLKGAARDMWSIMGEQTAGRFLLEGACFAVEIDPDSGKIRSLEALSACAGLTEGAGPRDTGTPALSELAIRRFTAGTVASSTLVPSGRYNFDSVSRSGRAAWADKGALLGVKLSYSLGETWTAKALALVGFTDSPVISAFKIVPLRGEV